MITSSGAPEKNPKRPSPTGMACGTITPKGKNAQHAVAWRKESEPALDRGRDLVQASLAFPAAVESVLLPYYGRLKLKVPASPEQFPAVTL